MELWGEMGWKVDNGQYYKMFPIFQGGKNRSR